MATPDATDFAQGAPNETSPLAPSQQTRELDSSQGDSTLIDSGAGGAGVRRTNSTMSQSHTLTPSRGGTLKKKKSLSKKGSVKRTGSRRSSYAGSISNLALGDQQLDGTNDEQMNNAFFTPVPTTGSPTEILANRFQAWRKVLKDLITYFRDIQKSYEARSKSLYTISNVINNTSNPPSFLVEDGIGDAISILRDYHKQSISEGNKAKTIEEDVVMQLTGLRSDLQQKIKEIKSLSGDFKNNVDRETEGTRKAVRDLQEALGVSESDPNASQGKGDPYIVKLGVDRQLERQIEEENYLHRAFLNLESSGRELESIVVGEIQKAYSAYASIIKREADEAYDAAERLRAGPISIAKDREWDAFVENNEHFVNPKLPVRRFQNISYPGKDHPAALEVKAGMLERKSKYLKSYTPGWYVLSPTHLHEFKSPDRISSQAPVMSLNLAEQKLGSHSGAESSSHKFMLKGRQTGGMHRGHAWVFRAESHDTMLAWFEDLKNLTEKTGEERKAFIRRHARSISGGSQKAGSISSEGAMEEDEADQVPYSAAASQVDQSQYQEKLPERPNPGGRFPSALNINRDSQVPLSPSSPSSSGDRDAVAAAGALPGSGIPFGESGQAVKVGDDEANVLGDVVGLSSPVPQSRSHFASDQKRQQQSVAVGEGSVPPLSAGAVHGSTAAQSQSGSTAFPKQIERHDSTYGDWMGPAVGGAVFGATASRANEKRMQSTRDVEPKSDEGQPPSTLEPVASTSTNTAGTSDPPKGDITVGEPPAQVKALTQDNAHPAVPYDPSYEQTTVPTQGLGLSSNDSGAFSQGAVLSHQPTQTQKGEYSPISTQRYYNGLPVKEGPSPTSVFGSGGAGVDDPAAPVKALADDPSYAVPTRPRLESHPSAATISDLHVPGEYPPTPAASGQPS